MFENMVVQNPIEQRIFGSKGFLNRLLRPAAGAEEIDENDRVQAEGGRGRGAVQGEGRAED